MACMGSQPAQHAAWQPAGALLCSASGGGLYFSNLGKCLGAGLCVGATCGARGQSGASGGAGLRVLPLPMACASGRAQHSALGCSGGARHLPAATAWAKELAMATPLPEEMACK